MEGWDTRKRRKRMKTEEKETITIPVYDVDDWEFEIEKVHEYIKESLDKDEKIIRFGVTCQLDLWTARRREGVLSEQYDVPCRRVIYVPVIARRKQEDDSKAIELLSNIRDVIMDYIVPGSILSTDETLNTVIGLMDNPDAVKILKDAGIID